MLVLVVGIGLAGCVETTGVVDGGNGTYVISARAAPIMGGAFGAREAALDEAQRFCQNLDPRDHVIVVSTQSQSVYGVSATGDNDLRFSCSHGEQIHR